MNQPVKIKLKEKTKLSLDAVNSKEYDKGTVLTSESTQQRRLFLHLLESDKADEVTPDEDKEVKTSKPKETKKKSKKKSTKKSDKE